MKFDSLYTSAPKTAETDPLIGEVMTAVLQDAYEVAVIGYLIKSRNIEACQ